MILAKTPEFDIDGKKLSLELICPFVPEAWDVKIDGFQAAYLRLRWGRFKVEVPDIGGTLVFEHIFVGDEYKGIFDTDEERGEFLTLALNAVLDHPEMA